MSTPVNSLANGMKGTSKSLPRLFLLLLQCERIQRKNNKKVSFFRKFNLTYPILRKLNESQPLPSSSSDTKHTKESCKSSSPGAQDSWILILRPLLNYNR